MKVTRPTVFRLPEKDAVLRQENITMRDLPARSASVLMVVALSAAYLPLPFILVTVLVYLAIEVWGILAVKAIERQMRWTPYLNLLVAATVGSCVFLNVLYEMWQLEGFAPRLFTFCTLTTALIHCATVRSYHLPLAIVTGVPVVVTITLTVVAALLSEARLVDTIVGLIILTLMIGYIAVMMIEGSRSRRILIAARNEADAASEAKGRFLATMSHEIRTPLNGILGIAQLMTSDSQGHEAKERADVLLSSAMALKTMVDDVLDHQKVEAGKLSLKPVPGDLTRMAQLVLKLFTANADKKGLTLTLEPADDFPEALVYDPVRLRQILSNLVSNAIKFTDRGGIKVRLFIQPDQTVCMEVHDTGVGIAKSAQAKLFARYTQVDDQQERAATGTGLGLSISQGLAELMGGDISVVSCAGHGSVFSLRFPAVYPIGSTARAQDTPADTGRAMSGGRVLIVDDNASNRFIARSFLASEDLSTDEAKNGAIAVEMAAKRSYDLILMDLHMPVMDGHTALRAIRASPMGKDVAIVALTANGSDGERTEQLAAGMDGFLSKPLGKELLLQEVRKHLPASDGIRAAE